MPYFITKLNSEALISGGEFMDAEVTYKSIHQDITAAFT
jgi:hypothetical protein